MKQFAIATLICLYCFMALTNKAEAQELIVSAAASLTDVFHEFETAFEKQHPDVDIIMNFAASGALYRQIEQGAPVDVYASANPKWMAKAVSHGFLLQNSVTVFARNALVLAVPANNPAQVTTIYDLSQKTVGRIGIGSPETVPAGQYAKEALEAKQLYTPLTAKMIFCESVRQVLDYLTRGEVDCGFIYRTDAVKKQHIAVVTEIPLTASVQYPIGVLQESSSPATAKQFVQFIQSQTGSALLEKYGFAPL